MVGRPLLLRSLFQILWSEKATAEFQLNQSRPRDLPNTTERDDDVDLHPPYDFSEPAIGSSRTNAGRLDVGSEPRLLHRGLGASSPGSSGKASILERGETMAKVEVRSYALQVTESPMGPTHPDHPGAQHFMIGSDGGDTPFREQESTKVRSLDGETFSQRASTAGRASDVRDPSQTTVAALLQRVKDLEDALVAERKSSASASMKSAAGQNGCSFFLLPFFFCSFFFSLSSGSEGSKYLVCNREVPRWFGQYGRSRW